MTATSRVLPEAPWPTFADHLTDGGGNGLAARLTDRTGDDLTREGSGHRPGRITSAPATTVARQRGEAHEHTRR